MGDGLTGTFGVTASLLQPAYCVMRNMVQSRHDQVVSTQGIAQVL
jgi:hypothetical protein